MGYLDAQRAQLYEPMGADVTVSTGNLGPARLQAAINRVLSGARTDSGLAPADTASQILVIGLQAEARATPLLTVDGVITGQTSAALRIAGQIAAVITGNPLEAQITTVAQMTRATDALNDAADRRGYPATDDVRSSNPLANLPLPPGVPPTIGGVSTGMVLVGAVGIGVAIFLFRRAAPRIKNPARRRRRRR